jgi:serine/threonine protein kinase
MEGRPPSRPQKIQGPLPDGALVDNKYQLSTLLGAGAMGAVYEAEHTGTGRRVALKVIMGQFAKDEGLVARFHREARAAGQIETQHITQVLDTGFDKTSELPFMVMEFLEGEDVQHLLKRTGPLHPEIALRIVAQACLGLQKAHEKSVVHRDIKPANLFLAKRDAGEVIIKLLDFGIAKIKMEQSQETESAGLTKTGNMLGSPLYMSPEQARGAKSIDHRTDIWSMGVVLYQCLCGKTPFQHLTALGELIISICSQHAQPVQERAPWVPGEVAAIAHKAMRHDPAHRYQSAQEMFQDIKALLPHGWSISDEMLAPLSESAKDQQAPKLALSMPPPPPMATIPGPAEGGGVMTASAPGLSGSGGGATSAGAGLTQSAPGAGATNVSMTSVAGAQPSGGKRGVVIGLAVIGVAALAGVGYVVLKPPDAVAVTPAPSASVTVVPTVAPVPTETASSTAPLVAPVNAEPQKYRVLFEPRDVKIEVDGQPVVAKGDIFEIKGTVGALVTVKLIKGNQPYETEVFLSQTGPQPPKIKWLPPGSPKPSGSASAGAAPPPKPTSTATRTDFE